MVSLLVQYRSEVDRRLGARERAEAQVDRLKGKVKELELHCTDLECARALVQEVARQTQEELEYCISELVTQCLQIVFDENIKMKVHFVSRRGGTEADIYLEDPAGNQIKPTEADGAGVVDIMSFGLRMVMYSLSKGVHPIFLLDEPFKKLNDPTREMHRKAAEMIKVMTDQLGVQILLVTLLPEMAEVADKLFSVKKVNGVSQVTCLK